MKKIIGIAAVAAMVATSAFAEITFGSWGRGLWYAAANSAVNGENEIVTGIGQSWGGAAPRTALSVHGSTDNVGFNLDVFSNGESFGQGDNANIWVKPIQQVQIKIGKMDDNVTRGDAAWGLWNWARFGAVNDIGEGFTFPDGDTKGAQILVTPVEGLKIIAALPLSLTDSSNTMISTELGHKAGYFAMYTIKNIGTVKAGLQCNPTGSDKDGKDLNFETINAAFDLTAVKNLYVSIGAFIPTGTSYVYDTAKHLYTKTVPQVNAYARYTFNALTLNAAVGTKINQVDNKEVVSSGDIEKSGLGLAFGAGADYAFANNIGAFVDVRYSNNLYRNATTADNKDNMTFGAGVSKSYSNGTFGIAFEGSTNCGGVYSLKNADDLSWAIPVKFEYSF